MQVFNKYLSESITPIIIQFIFLGFYHAFKYTGTLSYNKYLQQIINHKKVTDKFKLLMYDRRNSHQSDIGRTSRNN
jgi:mannitol-specific phosphotransferase system IIBC component